jgi:hypothetical protein
MPPNLTSTLKRSVNYPNRGSEDCHGHRMRSLLVLFSFALVVAQRPRHLVATIDAAV